MKKKLLSLSALGTVFVGNAMAALPADATTAIGDYKTDALAAGGLIMGAGIAIWGLLKLASKMGWR